MNDGQREEKNLAESKQLGHESRDIAAKPLSWLVAGSIAVFVCLLLLLWGFFQFLLRSQPETETDLVPSLERYRPHEGPPLQIAPMRDMAELESRERDWLNSYGWIDRENGIARIPISRAMELMVESGFPVRKGTNIEGGRSFLEMQQERVRNRGVRSEE